MTVEETGPVVERARAKINLALAVTGRRADGYHLLDTLAVFADVGDVLTAETADRLVLDIAGPFGAGLPGDGANLALGAAHALREAAAAGQAAPPAGIGGPGVRLFLDKRLPVAAGIGGGSADAAAALRALNALWRLGWPPGRLAEIGAALGADVPMCLVSRPLRARGIGEAIVLLPRFPALDLVLVNPGVAVSTAQVFAALGGRFSAPLPDPGHLAGFDRVAAYVAATGNGLEQPAIDLVPAIAGVLEALRGTPGCRAARMSGSGATCFGLFGTSDAAGAAAAALRAREPGWWVVACRTGPGDAPG